MSIHKINSSKLIKAYISPKNIDEYLNIKIQNIEIQNIETQNIKSLKIKKYLLKIIKDNVLSIEITHCPSLYFYRILICIIYLDIILRYKFLIILHYKISNQAKNILCFKYDSTELLVFL